MMCCIAPFGIWKAGKQARHWRLSTRSPSRPDRMRGGGVGFDAGKNVKGRKRHIVVDVPGMILKAEIHSAGIQDRDGAAMAPGKITARFPFIEKIVADGAYAGPFAQGNSPRPRPIEIVKRSDHRPKALSSRPSDGSWSEHSHGSA
ncbi:MAG: transposase [Alphaproteobacteria bacterium]